MLEGEVCSVSHNTVAALKSSISRIWAKANPADVKNACRKFRPRVEAMLSAEGGHIE